MRILGTTTSHGFGSVFWASPSLPSGFGTALVGKNKDSYFSSFPNSRRLNEKGLVVWNKENFAGVYALTIAPNEDVHFVGDGGFHHVKFSKSGEVLWAKRPAGENTNSRSQGVALDADGNSYSAGFTRDIGSTINIGRIIKRSSSGDILWARRLTSSTEFSEVAYCSVNNRIYGAVTTIESVFKTLVVALDASTGNTLWIKEIYPEPGIFSNSIDTDSLGNVYVAGSANNIPFVGRLPHIFKLDSSGNVLWAKTLAQQPDFLADNFTCAVAVDQLDNVYFGLYRSGVLKLNSSGDIIFQRSVQLGENPSANMLYITCAVEDDTFQMLGTSFGAKLSGDGAGIGTYGAFVYSLGNMQLENSTYTILNSSISLISSPDTSEDISFAFPSVAFDANQIYIK
jgi:hypothetical protein